MNLTPKQQAFCQAIVAGNSQSAAYRATYNAAKMKPATVSRKAYELMADGYITARVTELREPVIKKLRYDLEAAMAEASEALGMAERLENPSAMVAAVTLRAKLSGLLVEKAEMRHGVLEDASTEVLLLMRKQAELRIAARELTHAHHAASELGGEGLTCKQRKAKEQRQGSSQLRRAHGI